MKKLVKVVLLFAVLCTYPLSADICYREWVCLESGQCYPVRVCEPEYYVWQTREPDWCIYEEGDEVLIQFSGFTPVAWYVTPASDPGRDGDYSVVHDGSYCGLFQYPW